MKNMFVLKNIKDVWNRTESEHKNIGKKIAESQSKLSKSVPQAPQPSSLSRDVCKNTKTVTSSCIEVWNELKNIYQTAREKKWSTQPSGKSGNLQIILKSKRGPKIIFEWGPRALTIEMLERPDITYRNPGKKDHVYIEKIDDEKCYVQKRYLLLNLRDTSEILND